MIQSVITCLSGTKIHLTSRLSLIFHLLYDRFEMHQLFLLLSRRHHIPPVFTCVHFFCSASILYQCNRRSKSILPHWIVTTQYLSTKANFERKMLKTKEHAKLLSIWRVKIYHISHNTIKIRGSEGPILLAWSFFLSLYSVKPSFEYYRQVYFVHSGLQDESLQVTIYI